MIAIKWKCKDDTLNTTRCEPRT